MLNKNPELFGYAHYSYTTASAGCGVPRMKGFCTFLLLIQQQKILVLHISLGDGSKFFL